MPLFDQDNFMRLVTGWYKHKPKRDKPTWAAILVVIALGLGSRPSKDMDSLNFEQNTEWVDSCMRGAQSVLPELASREDSLLNVQVILALGLLFRNTNDLRPAGI